MKYRQRVYEYALKHGVTKAARRYHTYRQFVYRPLEKCNGSVRSLALRSRKPQHSPNAYKDSEFEKAVKEEEMKFKRMRPYSLWQNGKVERSHSEDSIGLQNSQSGSSRVFLKA